MVKNRLSGRDAGSRSLGRKDPLEKGTANPLHYSCLGNPTDRGAWRATVYGTKERQTRQPPPGLPRKVRKSPCVVHTAANASCPASWRKSVQPPAEGSGTPDRRSWMQAAKGSGITEDSVDVERSNTTSGCRKPRTASGRTEH